MELTDFLGPSQIIPQLAAKNRWEAIEELIAILAATGKVRPADVDALTDVVKRREHSLTTGIGFGIGVPTGNSDLIGEVVMALGRSAEGIEFDALNNQPVYTVWLHIVPPRDYQKNLLILANFGNLLHHIPFREAVRKAPDADAIYKVLCAAWRQGGAGVNKTDSVLFRNPEP